MQRALSTRRSFRSLTSCVDNYVHIHCGKDRSSAQTTGERSVDAPKRIELKALYLDVRYAKVREGDGDRSESMWTDADKAPAATQYLRAFPDQIASRPA